MIKSHEVVQELVILLMLVTQRQIASMGLPAVPLASLELQV